MKKYFTLLVLFLIAFATGKGLYLLKGGFNSLRIQTLPMQLQVQWCEEASAALKQPFHYLDRGRQCFAFASEDGRYVLKFPRTDIYKIPLWVRALGLKNYQKKLETRRKARQISLLESFQLAFSALNQQTAIVAIHIGQTEGSNEWLTIVDRLGSSYKLPLHKTSFLLQRKKPLLASQFLQARSQGQTEEAEKILGALLETIVERAEKGILNRDGSFLRNYGFDGEKAYQIDVGTFVQEETSGSLEAYEKSIRRSTDPIQEWLAQTAPECLDSFNKQLTAALQSRDQKEK